MRVLGGDTEIAKLTVKEGDEGADGITKGLMVPPTVVLFKEKPPGKEPNSDILAIGGFELLFSSDGTNALGVKPGITGRVDEASKAPIISVTAFSDIVEASEPGTLMILGAGLLGLGIIRLGLPSRSAVQPGGADLILSARRRIHELSVVNI